MLNVKRTASDKLYGWIVVIMKNSQVPVFRVELFQQSMIGCHFDRQSDTKVLFIQKPCSKGMRGGRVKQGRIS